MTILESAVKQNQFLLGYIDTLTKDLAPADWTAQPLPGVNHAAWIFGHLIFAAEGSIKRMGGTPLMDENWTKQYGGGSVVTNDSTQYPSPEFFKEQLVKSYTRVQELTTTCSDEILNEPNQNPRFKNTHPTMRDMIVFGLTSHFALHMGQLSAFRRMLGKPPLF
jgi:hypothetical protein